jgi:predicted transcriptional regulator
MTIQQQLAKEIISKRHLLLMSQSQLAAKVGTSQTAIARMEKCSGNPTAEMIQRISNALDLEMKIFVRPQR